jgi:hypothetical protein
VHEAPRFATRIHAIASAREQQVLGLWIELTECAKFWLKVVNELKRAASTISWHRAARDVLKGGPSVPWGERGVNSAGATSPASRFKATANSSLR